MILIPRLPLLLAILGVPLSVSGTDGAGSRDASDMTVEERTAIMTRVNEYNGCVYKESMARVEALPDIRQAADEGMTACQGTLDAVSETIVQFNFEPGFADQFVRHTQSRAVRMLIPELSLRKSGQ